MTPESKDNPSSTSNISIRAALQSECNDVDTGNNNSNQQPSSEGPWNDNSNPQQGTGGGLRSVVSTASQESSDDNVASSSPAPPPATSNSNENGAATTRNSSSSDGPPPLQSHQQQQHHHPPESHNNRAPLKIPPTQRDERKLFVGGLPSDVTDEEFRIFFGQFGEVLDSVVMFDRETFRSRGFGFVTFKDEQISRRVLGMGSGDGNVGGGVVGAHNPQQQQPTSRIEMRGKMIEIKPAQPKESIREQQQQQHQQQHGHHHQQQRRVYAPRGHSNNRHNNRHGPNQRYGYNNTNESKAFDHTGDGSITGQLPVVATDPNNMVPFAGPAVPTAAAAFGYNPAAVSPYYTAAPPQHAHHPPPPPPPLQPPLHFPQPPAGFVAGYTVPMYYPGIPVPVAEPQQPAGVMNEPGVEGGGIVPPPGSAFPAPDSAVAAAAAAAAPPHMVVPPGSTPAYAFFPFVPPADGAAATPASVVAPATAGAIQYAPMMPQPMVAVPPTSHAAENGFDPAAKKQQQQTDE